MGSAMRTRWVPFNFMIYGIVNSTAVMTQGFVPVELIPLAELVCVLSVLPTVPNLTIKQQASFTSASVMWI